MSDLGDREEQLFELRARLTAVEAERDEARQEAAANEIYAETVVKWRPLVEQLEDLHTSLAALVMELRNGPGNDRGGVQEECADMIAALLPESQRNGCVWPPPDFGVAIVREGSEQLSVVGVSVDQPSQRLVIHVERTDPQDAREGGTVIDPLFDLWKTDHGMGGAFDSTRTLVAKFTTREKAIAYLAAMGYSRKTSYGHYEHHDERYRHKVSKLTFEIREPKIPVDPAPPPSGGTRP